MLLCLSAGPILLGAVPAAETSSDELSLGAIISRIRANEAVVFNALAEGTYQLVRFEETGETNVAERGTFTFLRKGQFVRVELKRETFSRPLAHLSEVAKRWTVITGTGLNFHNPQYDVMLQTDSDSAHVLEPSMPPVFPISFGYWVRPLGDVTTIRGLSSDLEEGLRKRQLSFAQESDNESMLVLEWKEPPYRMRWWVDRLRGFLVAKARWDVVVNDPALLPDGSLDVNVPIQEQECSLRQFGKQWFVETAVERTYAPSLREKLQGPRIVYVSEEEKITVTRFEAGKDLAIEDIVFSTNRFPALRFLIDHRTGEVLNLKTGKRHPMNEATPAREGLRDGH